MGREVLFYPNHMESRTLKLLEFPRIIQYLSREAVSTPGQQACQQIRPYSTIQELAQEQALLEEAMKARKEHALEVAAFPELGEVLRIVRTEDAVLDQEGLWAVHNFLDSAHNLLSAVENITPEYFPRLRATWEGRTWPKKLWSALNRCLTPAAEIKDQSSPELQAVREEIRSLRAQCSKKINESLSQINLTHYLQDEYLTISSDRYVLALKSNFKGKLQGIIHDYSQTGETCYFEPMFLVDLNNKLQELHRSQKEEERKVQAYLTGLARGHLEDLHKIYDWLVRMDVLWAKTRLGERVGGRTLPVSHDSPLELKNIRHPLLILGGHNVVPVDISLNPGQKALVISGGNAGGKTVCLKSLGLAALMALCAIPVPADEGSSLPYWDKIFVSMVSEQSVEESLSTFTAQIEHFSRFWQEVDSDTLVLLDEFGVGTDPAQGAALAQAVLDSLLDKQAWAATATHFPALKAYALSKEDVRASSVLFDPETKKPLYKLAYDQVGSSQALKVAREQGLPGEIIDRAQEYLLLEGEEQNRLFERLNQLAAQREQELDQLREERTRLHSWLEQEREKLSRDKAKLQKELKEQGQEIVREWKEQKTGRKKAMKELGQIRQKADELVPETTEKSSSRATSFQDVQLQASYLYPVWNKTGIVREKDERKKQVKIDLGGISLWVDPSELEHPPSRSGGPGGYSSPAAARAQGLRLDIRGKYQDEALEELEKYLDQAILSGRKQVEIVHGKGTGALKKAVREYLRRNEMIRDFVSGSQESADDGFTTVELK